jgi:hypothetical protein
MPGEAPRLHGYDVEADLSKHYSFAETLLLGLTGELPNEEQATAFEVALQFLGPLSVAHAPTHAAVLARICGARFGSIAAVAALTLAERAHSIVSEHESFIAWLDSGQAVASEDEQARWRPTSEADRASAERLREALAERGVSSVMSPPFDELGRIPALLATLHFAGLRLAEQLEAAFVLASFALSVAEARAWKFGEFREYPINLPRFVYEAGDG